MEAAPPSVEQTQLPVQSPYLGDTSYLLSEDQHIRTDRQQTNGFASQIRQQILSIPELSFLPSKVQLDAYADAYFKHVFHRLPVVDRSDFNHHALSTPLCQAVCMVGSMMRHPKSEAPFAESEQYYTCAKINSNLESERDYVSILKTMCLLMTWNTKGHLILTLDCGWQWLGKSSRLLHQIGLHHESTYSRIANPGTARRIAWCIFVRHHLHSSLECNTDIWCRHKIN